MTVRWQEEGKDLTESIIRSRRGWAEGNEDGPNWGRGHSSENKLEE